MRDMPRDWQGKPLVYFLYALGAKAIKIGFTTDLKERVDAICTGCPFEVLPIAAILGPVQLERELHAKFAKWRLRGEWFDDTREIWEYIEANACYALEALEGAGETFVRWNTRAARSRIDDEESQHRAVVLAGIRESFDKAKLSDLQRKVLAWRFGFSSFSGGGVTLANIAAQLGVSGSRVGQLERSALARLRLAPEVRNHI